MKANNIYRLILGTSLLGGTMLLSRCKDKLDLTDENRPTTESYFKNTDELQAGVNAVYGTMRSAGLVGREWYFLHDCRADEVSAGGGQLEAPRRELLEQPTPATSNSVMSDVWRSSYIMISRANMVITSGASAAGTAAVKDRIIGEAKFLRAWAYFELVTHWGSVPVYTKPITEANGWNGKSPVADIYTLILSDVQDAVTKLPLSYSGADLGRATKGAANTLLAKVLMQKGDYAAAKTALQAVISSSQYSLVNDYNANFTQEGEFNTESIFEVVFYDRGDNNFNWGGYNTGDGSSNPISTVRNQEYCPVAWRNLIPSNFYLNHFENTATGATKTDPRYKMSVYETGDLIANGTETLLDADQNGNSSVVNGVTKKVSWRKFMLLYKDNKAASGFHPGGINQRIYRYADVLLMLAECEIELNNNAAAVTLMNQVRARQGVQMPAYPTAQYPTGTKNEALKALMHERLVELGDEEVRDIDILRWRAKGYYPSVVPEPRPGQVNLLPIPQIELDANPSIK